jgi:hypothetical protein
MGEAIRNIDLANDFDETYRVHVSHENIYIDGEQGGISHPLWEELPMLAELESRIKAQTMTYSGIDNRHFG